MGGVGGERGVEGGGREGRAGQGWVMRVIAAPGLCTSSNDAR